MTNAPTQKRKIIFLDVDGVLNHADFEKDHPHAYVASDLDDKAILRLKHVVDETGAEIVLSSSWRKSMQLSNVVRCWLRKYGMDYVSKTPSLYKERGYEIKEWLENRTDIESYVIFDDDDDMLDLMPHLVQTTWQHGLQDEHVERAIAILRGT